MSQRTPIVELARQARAHAESEVIVRHKKKASFALYKVLAGCMEMAERCLLFPEEKEELIAMFKALPLPEGKTRRYIEHGSDIYQTVCRYVFEISNSSNINRYAQVLREAEKKQLNSHTLEDFLRKKGGINNLYFGRQLRQRSIRVKSLRLASSITVSRDHEFYVRLRWNSDNTFTVIKHGGVNEPRGQEES